VGRLAAVIPGGAGLVIAPNGYGVTSLLVLAAEATHLPTAWVHGRGGVEPLSTLWQQACSALAEVGVDVSPADPGSTGPGVAGARGPGLGPADTASPWQQLARALRAPGTARPDVLLVLDDCPDDPVLWAFVAALLEEMPPWLGLLVGSATQPDVDLAAPLRAGQLVLVERGDLTLSPAEAEAYVVALGPDLKPRRRTALLELAGGWIGALRAALTAGGADPTGDPAGWLLEPGLELMLEPDLRRLDPLDRDLLVTSSILERLSGEACDAVTGRTDSEERLARLHRRLLVDRVPGPGPVLYELRPLVREFLHRKLAQRGRSAQAHAHEAAGQWLAEQGDAEGAITHLLECGQVDRARAVLAAHVGQLLDTGRSDRVRQWYRNAPQLMVSDAQLHLLGAAWSELLSGDTAAAGTHLLELEAAAATPSGAGESAEGAEWLRVETLFLRAQLESWWGQTGRAADDLREVLAAYGDQWTRAAHQTAAFHQVRLALWHRQTAPASERLRVLAARPGTIQRVRQLTMPSLAAILAAEEGRAHRARFLAETALEVVGGTGWVTPVDECDARLALALAFMDLNYVAAAEAEANRVDEIAGREGHVAYQVLGALARARSLAVADRTSRADGALEAARVVLRQHEAGRELTSLVDRAEVEVAIAAGDRARARRGIERLPAGQVRDRLQLRVLALGGPMAEAEVVQQVRRVPPTSPRDVVDARILMAVLTVRSRRTEAAMHLRQAAEIAREHGMLSALRGRAEEVVVLAAELAASGEDPVVAALVAALHEAPRLPAPRPERPALTAREYELLGHLARTAGNRELAAELGITMNTLKTRLRRLYAKLGVHDRASALAVASREG
jgi:LuxR family maltose regulon positive regulatory protein